MSPARILVVEDEAVVSMHISQRLRALGYEVVGKAAAAKPALELAAQTQPQLVLMDIRLKGETDGIEAAHEMRRRHRLPVVFLTAFAEDATLDRAKLAQPFGYILKPFEDRELKTAIELALYKHQMDEEVRRISRLYAVLSQVNQAIVRLQTPAELFDKLCQIALEDGGFPFAWVGVEAPGSGRLQLSAWRGEIGPHLDLVHRHAEELSGDSPAATGLRDGRTYVCNFPTADPAAAAGQALAQARHWQAVAVLPIRQGRTLRGVMTFYSAGAHYFEGPEVKLLEEVALDVCYALDHMQQEQQRQRAELALRESQSVLAQAQRIAHLGSWESQLRCVDDPSRNPLAWSDEVFRIFGYEPGEIEVSSEAFLAAVHPADRERVRTAYTAALRDGQPYLTEHRLLRRDGSERTVVERAEWVRDPDSGRPAKVVGTVQDVTEIKQLEAALRQSQKMESFGVLAGGVAHDFNNILSAILLNTEMLLERPELDAESRDAVKQIHDAGQRAANLTRQLLTFSRKQPIQRHRLDLNEVVSKLARMLRRIIGEDIALHCHFSSEPLPVFADEGMLEQVLMNLAVNARDAMPRGGDLVISLSAVTARNPAERADAPPQRCACMQMQDQGAGMPPEVLARIFEPFFTTKDVGKGTGLGLATLYGIVQQHEGWVEVESAVGQGTTFKVYLPVTTAPPPPAAESSPRALPRGTEGLLVVEDEPAVRLLVVGCLRRLGYLVFEASQGKEALELWAQHRDQIHLLLTDLVMPAGVSGQELAEHLKREKPALKVTYISGYSANLVRDLALVEKLNYLPKPFSVVALAQTVRACLDQ